MQAFGGIMSVTGEPEQRPVRVGTSIIDMATGMWSVIGVLVCAPATARRTARGRSIDTSLYETALGWMCYHAANFQASGELPKRQGSGPAMIVPYRGYASKDGFIVIAAGNDKLFAAFARVLGHPEWIDDRALSHQSGSGEEPGRALSLDRGAHRNAHDRGVGGRSG